MEENSATRQLAESAPLAPCRRVEVDAIAVSREDLAGDGRVVVEVQQESHGVIASEVVFHEEVCPDDWGCDIRDSDVPFVFAIAEADGHV